MSVQRRASRYSSRTVVPLDLRPLVGRREIIRSLETSDLKDARLRAAQWEGHVAGLFRRLRHNGRTMDQEQIDVLVSQYLDAELQEVETRLATGAWSVAGNNHAEHADWNGVARSLLGDKAEELEEALAYNNLTATFGTAQQMLPQSATEAQQVLARRLLETKYEAVMAELRALQGKPLPRRKAGALEVAAKVSPLVSVMVSDYIGFKKAGSKWTPKTTSQLTNLFRVMVELIGDKPVRDVSKDDMRGLYRLLPQFPTHAPKRYPGLTAVDAIAAADADGQDERLSPKTQNDYFTHIKSLWKWGAENDYVEKSPAVVLKDVDETAAWDQRPAFTDGQLKAYFDALKIEATSDPTMLWVPRLMLYAGLRTEEAAKLTPEDVREEQGVYVLDVNRRHGRLKTKNADRLVPIHSAILKDLLNYTAGRAQGENLWGLKVNSAGIYSAAVSKRLNGVLDVACPEDDKIVPYSLRHTFATRLKYADVVDSVLDELLGHKVEKLSMGRYGKRYPVEKLRDAVERLQVDL